jgi:hypothetical protein
LKTLVFAGPRLWLSPGRWLLLVMDITSGIFYMHWVSIVMRTLASWLYWKTPQSALALALLPF